MEVWLRLRALLDARHRSSSLLLFQEEELAIKKESSKKHDAHLHARHEHHKTPDQLAPPEEQRGGANGQGFGKGGAIVVDAAALKLPSEFTEKGKKEKRILDLEPVAIFIVAFALLFIGFIAYLISIEPPKPPEESKPTVEAQP